MNMSGEVQQHIQKFLYNLSSGDYASADKELKTIIDQKYQEQYDAAYEALKEGVGRESPIQTLIVRIRHAKKTGNRAELALARDELIQLAKRYNLLNNPEVLDAIS